MSGHLPIPSPRWSVILPVHNQADHLARVVAGYVSVLEEMGDSYEILLVPNGCRDESATTCVELAAEYPSVGVVPCSQAGWGHAVRMGLAQATGQSICFTNLARTSAADLVSVLRESHNHPRTVCKALRSERDSWRRRAGSRIYNVEAKVVFGLRVKDINGTPKVFPRDCSALLELTRDDDLIDLEFVVACVRHGYQLREVPIGSTRRHSGSSTTNWRTARRLLLGVLALRRDQMRA